MRSNSLNIYSATLYRILLPIALATVVAACGEDESRPVASRDFASEWVEVQASYPHVARAYLKQQSLSNVLPRDRSGDVILQAEWLPTLCELERQRLLFITPADYLDYCKIFVGEPPPIGGTACVEARISCIECNPLGPDPCIGCNTWENCLLSGGPD